ncbi:MAG: T9SS type A sorting domain-containing protein [Bacteroidetes bacterium]|nr:T9SS type A sorting domain-containing protein [Bacteroidota bacterium]
MKKHILWLCKLSNIFKITTILFFLFTIVSNVTAGEIRIEVESATARQGDHLALSVTGTIDVENFQSIQLFFKYNANRIKIDSVKGSEIFAVKCANPTIFDSTFAELGTLKVSCSDVQKILDGKICTLFLTCLAGYGNEASIIPFSIQVNDSNQIGNFISGKITFDDIPVIQKFIEGLGYPSPNPFGGNILVPYTIDEPTNVQFFIYDLAGRLVQDFPVIQRSRGGYFFYFAPNEGEFSNGAYYLLMKTNSKVYTSHFLRVR